jgi:hypothetical protein
MKQLWLLTADFDAPGWKQLQADSKEDKVDLLFFDRDSWALLYAEDDAPKYEGMTPKVPQDGMYIAHDGRFIYVVNRQEVLTAKKVIEALGDEAKEMLKKIGDADLVLQRLGRAF